ncbi:MAG: Heparinase II/III-like protein [Xanthobacteraceae bacterium]|nr:Heparinase II/III-like protein [Xanthobacteraceae bacterium]
MSRVAIAERTKLSLLLVRGGLRRLFGRVNSHPVIRLSFLPVKADRLTIAPQDLRTADATRASEIYAGRFAFAGKVVICDGRSPFEMLPPSDDWALAMLGFGWLRHLRAADSGITRANARSLVDDWISQPGPWNSIGWRPDVVARRIMSWITQATLVLNDCEVRFYRRFLRSLTRQVRFLRHTAADARDGVPRLQAMIALCYAALCLAGQSRHIKSATAKLVAELERQILSDGGHIGRNPNALIELLLDLLPLRHGFAARNITPPPALLNAIDRMMPMLRFFRHGDGSFAHFNGMGPTSQDLLATILAYDDARGAPLSNAPYSGYQRVEAGGVVVLVDTGRAPPVEVSQDAHAGFLSFELSARQSPIVVNCGMPANGRENWAEVARATAAHSTVTFNDTSSARFMESTVFKRLLLGTPMLGGPRHVDVSREERDDAILLRTSHDGYADRYRVVHQRALMLSADGSRLDGEDFFSASAGEMLPPNGQDEFAVRFHLHPSVKANRLTDGHGVMLVLPSKETWTFSAYEDRVELEESVYLAGQDGPRRTVQIVIYGRARTAPRVQWAFVRAEAPTAARRSRGEEPELPLY